MDKRRNFIINTIYTLLIAGIIYLIFKYAIFVVMPFLLGFAVAALLNPPVRYLAKKFDLNRRPIGILILLIFYATIGMLVTILVVRIVVMFGDLSSSLPEIYSGTIEPSLGMLFDLINRIVERFDDIFGGDSSEIFTNGLNGFFTSIKNSLGNAVSDISVNALKKLSSIAASIPGVVVQLLFAVISSFFFTVDYEEILEFTKKRLPGKAVKFMIELRDKCFITVIKYLRSYFFIMLITFAELSVGFLIIGIEKPMMIAFFISLMDILPIIGTGGIVIPWALISLIKQDYGLGIGLVVVWVVVLIVRNIIEPKIVGKQVGLHPLATLMAMFVGTKLFGVIGLFLLPISLAIVVSVYRGRDVKRQSAD